LRKLLSALVLASLAACFSIPRPRTPVSALTFEHTGEVPSRTLIVLLPGRFNAPDEFVEQGFVEAVRERGLAADLRIVDAHLGYYVNRVFEKRLREDVFQPARRRGYDTIWVVGISLGGLGSLLYAGAHPEDVDGIFAMAPYLGVDDAVEEVRAAGGLLEWTPGALDPKDYSRNLWAWLKGYTQPGAKRPPLYLAYGTDDDFALANAMLARHLPPERVFREAGGHDWPVWLKLWERFLDTAPFERLAPNPAVQP
jgi:pimeloyl-ACP methyl ester carboxylesterase